MTMKVRGLLLDVDGVLVLSWKPLPGAVAAMRAIRASGLPVAFLTNTTSRTRRDILDAMAGAGIPADDDELVTAGSATAAFLAEELPGARCLMLNDGPLDDFAGVRLVAPGEPADAVVIGSAGPSFSWEAMNGAARAVTDGARLVAMHGSTRWQTEQGLCIDGGAYVAALERATGRRATTIGKPAAPMFTAALAHLGVAAGEAVMVGDDLESDVLGAQAVGITGLLVRTGKFRPETLAAAADRPDDVLDTVADLPRWLGLG
jgi:HAD superfamily hydrolase (TIGR01458 family)